MLCKDCGDRLPDDATFCSGCGTPAGNVPAPATRSEPACDLTDGYFGTDENGAAVAAWVTSMPFFKNSVAFKQLALVVGAPWYGMCALIFWIEPMARIGVLVMAAVPVIATLVVAWLHGWKHEELYVLDGEGASRRYTGETGGKLAATFGATTLGGIVLGNWAMSGASLLAASRISEAWTWKSVRKAVYRPGKGHIKLWGGLFGLQGIWLFTSPGNFERIADVVRQYTKHLETAARVPAEDDAPEGRGRIVTMILGVAAILVLIVALAAGIFAWQSLFGEKPDTRPLSQRLHDDVVANQARMKRQLEEMRKTHDPEEQKRLVEVYNATHGRLKSFDTTGTGYADVEGFKKLDKEK